MLHQAWISCASWVPTSDFLFPSILRSICLCREIKERAVWQTSDKALEAHGFWVCDRNGPQVSHSTPNKGCSDPNDTFHPNAFTGRFSFSEVTHRLDQGTRHLSFWNRCFCQVFNTSTIHLPSNASKVGVDDFVCDVNEVTAHLRCTPCLSHGDAALQPRPQLQHCTEQRNDFHKSTCLTVSFAAAPAAERNPRFLCKSL